MDKLIIPSRNELEDGTHIRVSKKMKELVDDVARRSGRSQYVIVNVVKAAWAIFGKSYEYRQKYNAYKKARMDKEKEMKFHIEGQLHF